MLVISYTFTRHLHRFGRNPSGHGKCAAFNSNKGAGGEVANAQVCKTCIRGFNSRPALQISRGNTIAFRDHS